MYYHKKTTEKITDSLINIFRKQVSNLKNVIQSIKPDKQLNWLDLGCGKGKLINIIKPYQPKFYYGIDLDDEIIKTDKHRWEHKQIANLCNSWKDQPFAKHNYDIIVANFSLPHFWNDHTVKQLSSLANKNTILIFNYVPFSEKLQKWSLDKSWITVEQENVEYFFEWCHLKPCREKAFSIDYFVRMFKQDNWELVDVPIKADYSNLSKFYDWTIWRKN